MHSASLKPLYFTFLFLLLELLTLGMESVTAAQGIDLVIIFLKVLLSWVESYVLKAYIPVFLSLNDIFFLEVIV